jgi:hypothetical protein
LNICRYWSRIDAWLFNIGLLREDWKSMRQYTATETDVTERLCIARSKTENQQEQPGTSNMEAHKAMLMTLSIVAKFEHRCEYEN